MPANNGTWYVVKKDASGNAYWGDQGTSNANNGAFSDSYRSLNNLPVGDLNDPALRPDIALSPGGTGADLPYLYNNSSSINSSIHYCSFHDFVFTTSTSVTKEVVFIFRKDGAGSVLLGFEPFGDYINRPDNTDIKNIARGLLFTRKINSTQTHDNFYYRPYTAGVSTMVDISLASGIFSLTAEKSSKAKPVQTMNVPIGVPTKWQMVRFRISHPPSTTMKILCDVGDTSQTPGASGFYVPINWNKRGKAQVLSFQAPPGQFLPVISFGASSADHQLHGVMINEF